MKPVIKSEFKFWGRNAKALAKYLRPASTSCAPCGPSGKWQLHSFTLLPDWMIDSDPKRRERCKSFAALLKRTRQ